MTDLIHVLPDYDSSGFSHILPSLERALITVNDLLTLQAIDVAKRATVPVVEVQRFVDDLFAALHASIADFQPFTSAEWTSINHESASISTLDERLDEVLNGGFPTGQLIEVTGESAAGKTQLLLSLLLAVQLPAPHGLSKTALYITTEGPLQTSRLSQILAHSPLIDQYEPALKPSLSRVQSITVSDLEYQEHVLRYQVPVVIARNNIGLIVIDSIAANFRAEFNRGASDHDAGAKQTVQALADRSRQLISLGAWLRQLAREHNIAIVVANQVIDRFATAPRYESQSTSQPLSGESRPHSSASSVPDDNLKTDTIPLAILSTTDSLALDHQQRFFTGWGDTWQQFTELKTPSLGLTWTNQLAARIVLYKSHSRTIGTQVDKDGIQRQSGPMRTLKVAFSSWCADDNGRSGTAFEIWKGGLRAL